MIADHFRKAGADVVAGPTTPGIIISYETARQLGVRGIFAEKDEARGIREFRRGFQIKPGEKVLIVDDIFTTGSSVREVMEAVNKSGGKIVGVGVLVDRSSKPVDLGVPFYACHRSEEVALPRRRLPTVRQRNSAGTARQQQSENGLNVITAHVTASASV